MEMVHIPPLIIQIPLCRSVVMLTVLGSRLLKGNSFSSVTIFVQCQVCIGTLFSAFIGSIILFGAVCPLVVVVV